MENVLDVVTENGLILFDQETWDIDNSITLRCREPSRIPYHNEFRWSTGKLEFGLKWAAKDFATFVIIFLSVFLAFRATYRWKLSTWNVVLFERSVFQCWWWDIMCIYRFTKLNTPAENILFIRHNIRLLRTIFSHENEQIITALTANKNKMCTWVLYSRQQQQSHVIQNSQNNPRQSHDPDFSK